jgi:hypothetical protein
LNALLDVVAVDEAASPVIMQATCGNGSDAFRQEVETFYTEMAAAFR